LRSKALHVQLKQKYLEGVSIDNMPSSYQCAAVETETCLIQHMDDSHSEQSVSGERQQRANQSLRQRSCPLSSTTKSGSVDVDGSHFGAGADGTPSPLPVRVTEKPGKGPINSDILVFPSCGVMSPKLGYHVRLDFVCGIFQEADIFFFYVSYPGFDTCIECANEDLGGLF
jgi:hypothetical protein